MFFSRRLGFVSVQNELLVDKVSDSMKIKLWNLINIVYWHQNGSSEYYYPENRRVMLLSLWLNFLIRDYEEINQYKHQSLWNLVKERFMNEKWYYVYDFIEYMISINGIYANENYKEYFKQQINQIMEQERSAYRLTDGGFVSNIEENEIKSIDDAILLRKPESIHIKESVKLLYDRKKPNYRNSVKESISAVEAICRRVTGNPRATLGCCLKDKKIKDRIQPAFKKALSELYGYTSDAEGIRHSLTEKDEVSFDEAKFMLTICSAFVNMINPMA